MLKNVYCHEAVCPYGKKPETCCVGQIEPEESGEITTLYLKCRMKKSKKVKAVYVKEKSDAVA